MPTPISERQQALRLIGLGLALCEKAIQIYDERTLHPTEKQHQPWLDRVEQQLRADCDILTPDVYKASPWL